MRKQTTYKELYDPFSHYTRGILYFDKKRFTFVAYRRPYRDLDSKSWKTEREFDADYRKMVSKKYVALN